MFFYIWLRFQTFSHQVRKVFYLRGQILSYLMQQIHHSTSSPSFFGKVIMRILSKKFNLSTVYPDITVNISLYYKLKPDEKI